MSKLKGVCKRDIVNEKRLEYIGPTVQSQFNIKKVNLLLLMRLSKNIIRVNTLHTTFCRVCCIVLSYYECHYVHPVSCTLSQRDANEIWKQF